MSLYAWKIETLLAGAFLDSKPGMCRQGLWTVAEGQGMYHGAGDGAEGMCHGLRAGGDSRLLLCAVLRAAAHHEHAAQSALALLPANTTGSRQWEKSYTCTPAIYSEGLVGNLQVCWYERTGSLCIRDGMNTVGWSAC